MPFHHGKFGSAGKSEKPAAKPEHEKSAAPQQEHKPSAMHESAHTKDSHGTAPHSATGVHAVHIHHHEGGAAKTHTHHADGSIETQDHPNLAAAHEHAQAALPPSEESGEKEPMMADDGAAPSNLQGLGSYQG